MRSTEPDTFEIGDKVTVDGLRQDAPSTIYKIDDTGPEPLYHVRYYVGTVCAYPYRADRLRRFPNA